MVDHQVVAGMLSAQLAAAMHGKNHQSSMRTAAVRAALTKVQQSEDVMWVADLVLQCLRLLPRPLAAVVAEELLLQPFVEALEQGTEAAYDALLAAAVAAEQAEQQVKTAGIGSQHRERVIQLSKMPSSRVVPGVCLSGARQCLHALGFLLGVQCWQTDCLAYVVSPSSSSSSTSRKDDGKWDGVDFAELPLAVAAATLETAADSIMTSSSSIDRHAMESCEAPAPQSALAVQPGITSMESAGAVLDTLGSASLTAAAGTGEGVGHISASDPAADGSLAGAIVLPSVPMGHCQEVVEHIRHSYCVGSHWEGEVKEWMEHSLARLGKAIKRLAGELYSKDIHFVMELVQVGTSCWPSQKGSSAPKCQSTLLVTDVLVFLGCCYVAHSLLN
jgi:hypothetical protein